MPRHFPGFESDIGPIRHDVVADGKLVLLDSEGRSMCERRLVCRHDC